MKPAPFQLHIPSTLEEAVGLLSQHGEEAKVLAGGQSLVPLMALRLARYEHLVDVNRIAALQGIAREGGWLTIGAMTRQTTAEAHRDVALVPLLHQALPLIGHFQIRNRGTVGGSTAHADPASELPAVALALDAEMVIHGPAGGRVVPAREFFVSTWTTGLKPDEILTAVRYPVWPGHCGFALEEFARRSGDFAIAGVACGLEVDQDGDVARAAIAYFGMAPTAVRASAAEAALVGSPARGADLAEIARLAASNTDPGDDIHGSAGFRRRVAAHLTERALERALRESIHA
ncbi:MAG: xanthine dehydrogenase family protein subunit M [Actinomycetota bacterium]|nr:xanthine dehydrogenase family protein subunit M [Actinomycetota bacterium]